MGRGHGDTAEREGSRQRSWKLTDRGSQTLGEVVKQVPNGESMAAASTPALGAQRRAWGAERGRLRQSQRVPLRSPGCPWDLMTHADPAVGGGGRGSRPTRQTWRDRGTPACRWLWAPGRVMRIVILGSCPQKEGGSAPPPLGSGWLLTAWPTERGAPRLAQPQTPARGPASPEHVWPGAEEPPLSPAAAAGVRHREPHKRL